MLVVLISPAPQQDRGRDYWRLDNPLDPGGEGRSVNRCTPYLVQISWAKGIVDAQPC